MNIMYVYQNYATGEHSCMVLKPLETGGVEDDEFGSLGFLALFYQCEFLGHGRLVRLLLSALVSCLTNEQPSTGFKTKFVKRLPLCFRGLDYKLAMRLVLMNYSVLRNKQSHLLMTYIIYFVASWIRRSTSQRMMFH